jgi:ElaB/YqjD/DUF883 family membrane-anchored ribosome-binding protein
VRTLPPEVKAFGYVMVWARTPGFYGGERDRCQGWNLPDRQTFALPQQRRKVRDDFVRPRPSPWSPQPHGEMSAGAAMEARMAQARAASNNGRDAKEDFDALRSDLDTLRKDFGTFVSTLKDNASSRAEAELDAMRQRLTTLSSDLQATGQQQLRKVEAQVGERPFTSLALAFATGLIVGRMLDRR